MALQKISAVLFDLDGVLVDSIDAWYYTYNDALAKVGRPPLSKEAFAQTFGSPVEHDLATYFQGLTEAELVSIYNSCFQKHTAKVRIFPETKPVLTQLSQKKIKIGLITNSSREIVNRILQHFSITEYFGAVVTLNDVSKRKPAPDMIVKACELLTVVPNHAVVVGDTKNDIMAAKNAGCLSVGYKIHGDFYAERLSEVIAIITQN